MNGASDRATTLPDADGSRRLRWCAYATLFAIAFGMLTASVWKVKPLLSANDRSRWCTVWSLVERGTYQIDEIDAVRGWSTIDKVRSNGHFYSSKPPLLATLVAGVYWCVKKTTGWTLDDNLNEVTHAVLFLVNVLPLLLGMLVMVRLVERYAGTTFARIFVTGTFALGTFLTTFSMTLNNHTVAALAVLFSIYACCRVAVDGCSCPRYLVLSGFFAGFAAVNELPATAFAAAAFAIVVWKRRVAGGAWFLGGALLPVAAFFLTSYLESGDWRPFYAYYGGEKYKYVVDGVPSYWMHPAGLDANVESPLVYLLHCTFGHHGIFSLSPVFLLALVSWCVPQLSRQFALRTWMWASAAITVVVIAFYLTRTQNYNYGGNTAGLRWTFWLIPLWLISSIPVLDAWCARLGFRVLACALLAATTFSSWYPIENPWQSPWLFQLMTRWGWIDYSSRPQQFTRPVYTFFPLLPPHPEAREWIEFAVQGFAGGESRLRIQDEGNVERGGRTLRKISMAHTPERGPSETFFFIIDAARFSAGATPEEYLDDVQGPGLRDREAGIPLLEGLPSIHAFRRGTLRYVKTPLRNNAFECRLAAAQVSRNEPETGRTNLYRVDAWLTAAVPFGVLQFEQTVRDDETEEILSCRRYVVARTSRTFSPDNSPPTEGTDQTAEGLNIPR